MGTENNQLTANEKFRLLRKKLGMTQKALADETGIALATIKNIESNKQEAPGFSTLERLAEYTPTKSAVFWLVSPSRCDINDPVLDINPENPPTESPLYADLLSTIIEAIEEALTETGKAIHPEKKAELISILYNQTVLGFSESNAVDLDKTNINSLIKLAT